MSKIIKLNEQNYNTLKELVKDSYNSTLGKCEHWKDSIELTKELIESGEYKPKKKTIEKEKERFWYFHWKKEGLESLIRELGITIEI